ncbi:PorP/SprF family type IX secretion system membrane protein [Tenacibaculum sp. nBUS_03]|uniref:PorP/SprF family type IX secretion system membrane protein n=1 Tax=Tenacibaculum sp. nBUS_03 TaxID=3395320 RepID=UPI003EB7DB91
MKKLVLFISLTLSSLHIIVAQQDPQYTQYTINQSVFNPAYVTNELGVVNFGFMHRSQWTSAIGAPKTYTLFAHTPLSEKFEVGFSLISDDIGNGTLKETNFYADFAYIIQLTDYHKLSLGLKAGFTSLATNFDNFRFPDDDVTTGFLSDDIAFVNQNSTLPSFGIGAFYYTNDYYFGIAAPNLINAKHIKKENGLRNIGGEEIHLFINAGYVYKLSDVVKLKPSFLLKAVKGSPAVVDTSLNLLFNNRFQGGISYRVNDSFSAMFNLRATSSLSVGYAFDFTTSNLSNFNSGSHEVFILFDFDTLGLKKGFDKSPRFF